MNWFPGILECNDTDLLCQYHPFFLNKTGRAGSKVVLICMAGWLDGVGDEEKNYLRGAYPHPPWRGLGGVFGNVTSGIIYCIISGKYTLIIYYI